MHEWKKNDKLFVKKIFIVTCKGNLNLAKGQSLKSGKYVEKKRCEEAIIEILRKNEIRMQRK